MDSTKKHSQRPKIRSSLRLRLTIAMVFTVLTVTGIGMVLDYREEYRVHIAETRASLEEQARSLQVARRQIEQPGKFAAYVDDFCAQMNEYVSPGHHILVLDRRGEVLVRARHHSGPAVEKALLASDSEERILSVQGHRLAQVRLKDDDGATIILAQYMDHVERILRRQLISRATAAGAASVTIIILVFLAIEVWGVRPIARLARAAKAWSARDFSAKVDPTGPSEIRFLSGELNAMAGELERHECQRNAELEQAKEIQANMLPHAVPQVPGLTVAAEYHPAAHVAGDLYDIFELPGNRTAVTILDVTGHGITAALLTGVVRMSLRYRLAERDDLPSAMAQVSDDLSTCTAEIRFATACVGVWNPADRTWVYCAAGHPGGMVQSGGDIRILPPTAPLLGIRTESEWSSAVVHLSPGDRVFLFTDGVYETGPPGDMLNQTGLRSILAEYAGTPLTEQISSVIHEVAGRTPSFPADDATIVAAEVLPQ